MNMKRNVVMPFLLALAVANVQGQAQDPDDGPQRGAAGAALQGFERQHLRPGPSR